MKVLVINSGSSSVKYQLFNMKNEEVMVKGVVERIGIENSFLKQEEQNGEEIKIQEEVEDHSSAINLIVDTMLDNSAGILESMEEIEAVGHRVVHGGEEFAGSVKISDDVIAKMEEVSDLAPLHNPPNLAGIKVCQNLMPDTPQIGVFDTSFHQTMPEYAYIYALPYEYYENMV